MKVRIKIITDEITMNLTTEEMDLVTRSLSDSMNYKPNDRFDEKYSLLLHCQRKQSELEKKKRAEKSN